MADRRSWLWVAAAAALLAAFIWAGYYFFILALTPTTRSAALFTYPFLFGGLTYTGWALRSGHGRIWLSLWASPMAWARVALIVTMQLSVLASTYLAGPVETSLLTLVGDVVMTPALLLLLFGEGRAQARSPSFLAGITLSTLGASLTIIGGTALHALPLVALPLAVIVPASVALYFLASARANRRLPSPAVVGQATLGGGLIGVVLSPLFPGGFASLAIPSVGALLLLVALGVTSFYLGPVLYFWAIERAGMILPGPSDVDDPRLHVASRRPHRPEPSGLARHGRGPRRGARCRSWRSGGSICPGPRSTARGTSPRRGRLAADVNGLLEVR